MNQDFTVQKESNICLKEKFVQRGSPKKKFVQAENSPPPITFLMVRP